MSLEDIVSVVITAATSTPTKPGFGTPLIAAGNLPASFNTTRVQSFTSLTGMTSAEIVATHPAYLAAAKVFSQNPRPKRVKVAKRALPPTQALKVTISSVTNGQVYTIKAGVTSATFTAGGADTTTTVAAALATALDLDPVATASNVGAVITISAAAGVLVNVSEMSGPMTFKDDTPNPGIETDLAEIASIDSDWYGLVLDSNGELEVKQAAIFAEANDKLFGFSSMDSDIATSSTTDLFSDLKLLAYKNTFGVYSKTELLAYSGAAIMGKCFPFDPGSETWNMKTISGVSADSLTDGEYGYVTSPSKNGNTYNVVSGLNLFRYGKTFSGEYIDVTRFIAWMKAEIKVRVLKLFADNKKVPFTDSGIDLVKSIVMGVLKDAIRSGGLAAEPAPVVNAPKASEVSALDKANRLLPDVTFNATLAGAIHHTEVEGLLSV